METLRDDEGVWILDVAHNPAGATALVTALRDLGAARPLVIVCAMMRQKAWQSVLEVLRKPTDAMVLTVAPSHPQGTAWDPDRARAHLEARRTADGAEQVPVEVLPNMDGALARARELAQGGTVVVTGSCYLVGDAGDALRARGSMSRSNAVPTSEPPPRTEQKEE